MFPVKGRNKTHLPQRETYLLGPHFTIQASPVSDRVNKQDPLLQKANDLLNTSNPRSLASSSLDGPITANLQVETHRNNVAHGSQKVAGVPSKRQVLTSTAFVHELSNHTTNADHMSSQSSASSAGHHGADLDHQSSRSAQSTSRSQYNSSVYLPGDRVIFTENASNPGVPVVYRTPEERAANPDRLNLDRRRLAVCPILEGEDQLRLLNYQHNFITRIQHLNSLKRLIFLDLYDNQITEISGLSSLKSLRVLMLGKNRIKKIDNLEALTKLDVLDLHGNEISHIDHLNHLAELRVLNLAGNKIQYVDNLSGMSALTELNLRRNNIHTVAEVDTLPNLQRLFLSFNEITSFEDIQCLADSPSLAEISLDGNPFAQEPHYKQIVLRYMHQLRQFDMKRVSEDERRIASVMAKKEEDKKRESYKTAVMKERRRVAISNARRHWELMQGSAISRLNKMNKRPTELYANHISNVPSSDASQEDDKLEENASSRSSSSQLNSRPTSAKSTVSDKEWTTGGSTKHQSRAPSRASSVSLTSEKEKFSVTGDNETAYNLDFLSEIEGDTLNLYGVGALEAFDRSWGVQAAGAVTTICFKFIDFDHITKVLHKIRVRFPNVNTLIFNSTNISSLAQLNALSSIRRLDNLVIEKDGNPITEFVLWRTYLLFRLAHFCLKKINDIEIKSLMSLSKGTCLSGKTYWSSLSAITITMETKKDVTATSATESVNSETENGSVASASVEREQFGDTKQRKYTIMIDLRQVHRVGEHQMVMISEKSDGSGRDTVGKSGAKDGRTTRNAQQEVKAGKDAVKKLVVCNHGNSMVKEKSAELVMTRNTTCEHHCNKSLMKQVKGQVTQTKPTVGVKGQGVLKVSHLAKQGQVSLEGQGQKVGSEQEQGKNPARTKPSLPSNGNGEEESKWSILREVLAEANVKLNSEVPEYDLWLPRKQQKCLRKLKDLLKPVSMESFELVQLLVRGDGEEASDEKGCKTENDNRRKMLSDNKRKSVSDNSLITGSQWDQFMFSLFLEDYGYHVTRSTDRASCMENVVKEMLNDEIFLSEVMSRLVSASDIVNAEKFFGTLAHMTTSQLPQARLLALLGDKKKQLLTDERNRKSETKLTDRTTESVGRAGLVYTSTDALQQKTQDLCHRQKFVQHYVKQLTYDAVQCNQKQTMLHGIWPEILSDMVHSAVLDMWDTNSYMKRCLEEVERS